MNNKKAFTLIELSIVLIIVGLLVGGVMGGQALIQQARLQKLGTLLNQYGIAVNSFKMQYNGLPGDITGTKFWNCSGLNRGCNGDNNGQIYDKNDLTKPEPYLFWYHLNQAGLINSNYTGEPGTLIYNPGVNCPEGPLGGCFGARYAEPYSTESHNFIEYGNLNTNTGLTDRSIISPQDAFSLINKFDNGKADSGKILILPGDDKFKNLNGTTADCSNTHTWNQPPPAILNLTYPNIACRIMYNID